MDPVTFVEVLDHRGRVRSRHRLTTLPIRIGRSYRNDVIIDDPWVSAEHVEIHREPDGSLVAVDRGSDNGTYRGKSKDRITQTRLAAGDRLRIGRTGLRICTAATEVPPTVAENPTWARLGPALERPAVAAALVVGVVTVLTTADAITTTDYPIGSGALALALALMMSLAAFGGAWALGARLRGRRPRFLQHVAWLAIIVLTLWIGVMFFTYLTVIAPRVRLWAMLEGVLTVGLAMVWLVGHLTLASNLTLRLRLVIAASTVIGLLTLGALAWSAEEGSSTTELSISYSLWPVPRSLLLSSSSERFFDEARRIVEHLEVPSTERVADVGEPVEADRP